MQLTPLSRFDCFTLVYLGLLTGAMLVLWFRWRSMARRIDELGGEDDLHDQKDDASSPF